MTTAYTSLLGLALPVTGELSGVWGDTVNNSITSLLDSAIAGTTTLSSDADVTLTTTTGASNTSRQAILLWTAGGTVTRNITAPAQSKIYTVINKSSSTQSIVLRGVGPTTGVTIVKGESAVCAWNGSDFIKISNTSGAGVFTTVTASSLTSGRVTYATTAGLLTDSANLLYSGTDLTVYGLTVGRGAGAVATNTAVGASALAANTSGSNNVAVGYRALSSMTTGNTCVAIGQDALKVSVAGTENTAVGFQSMLSTLTASANSALGLNSLSNNTTGNNNTAIGYAALTANTTASNNTAVGYRAGYSNTTGAYQTFIGNNAGYSITTGTDNTAIGNGTLYYTVGGQNNVALGSNAVQNNTSGSYNVGLGALSLFSNTTASNNTAVGYQAGYSNTTGVRNSAFGDSSLRSNTTANNNNAFGYLSLYTNTTGTANAAFGTEALTSNTTASDNTAVGYQAGYSNTTGISNTAVGKGAGYTNSTSSYSVFVGVGAGRLSVSERNTMVGAFAGDVTTGANNTFIGQDAGALVTTGAKNTIVGRYNGNSGGLDIRTASNYIVLSDGDGNPRLYLTNTGTCVVPAIYADTTANAANMQVDSGGVLRRSTSALKYKQDIRDIEAIDINLLRGVRYKSKSEQDDQTKDHFGIVADEVDAAGLKELVTYGADGEVEGFQYERLTVVLLKAMQTLKAEVDTLKSQLNGA